MAQHNQSPGKGVLYTNDYKKQPSHPDWRGEFMLQDGTVLKLSAWTKNTPRGTLLSLAEDNYKGSKENTTQYPKELNAVEDGGDLPF